jgi:DNA-binding PadR family transcriptional regulator
MALRREDRDLAALTVLAMLTLGPRHTYEMHRFVVQTRKDYLTGLPRSMYHAVDRLTRDGLIEVDHTAREPGRPERTLYRLTDRGRDVLTNRLTRLLAIPDRDATLLVAGLSLALCLPRTVAEAALRARGDALGRAREELRRDLGQAGDLDRILLVEAEFELARLGTEHDWVVGFLDELAAGSLRWPSGVPEFPGADDEPGTGDDH